MSRLKIVALVAVVSLLGGCAQAQLPHIWGGVSTQSKKAVYETGSWVDCPDNSDWLCPEEVVVRDSSVSLDVEFSWEDSILNISWAPLTGDTSFSFMFPWFTPKEE